MSTRKVPVTWSKLLNRANWPQAHKWSVENGYFHFSEAGYLKYALGYDTNITDQVSDLSSQ
jgi:hypothetical protein